MKSLYKQICIIFALLSTGAYTYADTPGKDCGGHPLCGSSSSTWGVFRVIGDVIALGIKYVAILAVIAVMIGGIMYLLSSGQEEKTKKAKNVIIWALVGVFLSVSAMALINIVNNFRIF